MYKKIIIYISFLLCASFFTLRAEETAKAPTKRRPNVVFIYANDMGKGLLSAYGQKHYTTPNIDTLINSGVSFKYAFGGSISSYARASLLTGYHDCSKNKWRISRGGVYIKEDTVDIYENENFINGNNILLPENNLYLPQVFGNAGYVTAQIGMLGWGNTSTRRQMFQHGWDYFYGYLDHMRSQGYYPTFLFENERIEMIEGNTRIDCGRKFIYETENETTYNDRWNMEGKKIYSPNLLLEKTIEFIRQFKDKPFFLMYATPLPGPVSIPSVHPEVANNKALTQIEKEYASMMKLLDDHVGAIISELRSLGLEENTLIVIASDNGHDIHYLQENRIDRPFRNIITNEPFDNSYSKYYSDKAGDVFNGNMGMAGLKGSNLNGGINIPFVFYWKGELKKRVCEDIVSTCDFLPAMADFFGVKLETRKDGISFLPALMKGRKLPQKRFVIVSSEDGPAIIVNDGWKLRFLAKPKKYELYNIRKDPEEKYDVILRFTDKAEDLKKLLIEQCGGNIDNGVIY
ncbi:MAG: sulfatase-like hydrolase/transferase [Tannerella sp.]|jgi:arylsulfatase A-like enzyme|nr:sulfatase-like hydrolase/transferase [Tannerella sp.]